MELEEGKKYECKRKSDGLVVCTIYIMNKDWLDTKSDRKAYDYDMDLLDIGKYVFRDIVCKTDIFEIEFSPNNIRPNMVYIKWLCQDYEIKEVC